MDFCFLIMDPIENLSRFKENHVNSLSLSFSFFSLEALFFILSSIVFCKSFQWIPSVGMH